MSNYEPKEGDIAIFLEGVEGNRPLFKGTAIVDGKKRQIALWPKKGTTEESLNRVYTGLKGVGVTMFRGVIEEDNWKPEQSDVAPERGGAVPDTEDTIPF